MDWVTTFFNGIKTEHIALFSVVITIIIFILNKRSELRYKKHEDKKGQYIKLIQLLNSIFGGSIKKDKNGNIITDENMKQQFFDIGSSLLLYGSKKLYKQYIFFREYSANPLFQTSKYYDKDNSLFLVAKLLVTIRKEVGISNFNNISLSDSLAYFVNAISNNPHQKSKEAYAKYKLRMLKLEMFFIDRTNFILTKKVFNSVLRPIGGFLILTLKYVIGLPVGKLLIILNPNLSKKNAVSAQDNDIKTII